MELYFIDIEKIKPEILYSMVKYLLFDEMARASKFLAYEARLHFIAGRYLLRKLLPRYGNGSLDRIPLICLEFGKPSFPVLADETNQSRPHFNLSHSGNIVAIGLSSEKALGIDIEKYPIERDLDREAAADLVFLPSEKKKWLENRKSDLSFLQLWTIMEASTKKDGLGIPAALERRDSNMARTGFLRKSGMNCGYILSWSSDPPEDAKIFNVLLSPKPDKAAWAWETSYAASQVEDIMLPP